MNVNTEPTTRKSKKVSSSKQGARYIKEFKEFIRFLRNLWGILAGVSVFFPLSNVFMQVIPLDTFDHDGVLVWFSPRLFTTFATLVSLFMVLWTFSPRQQFRSSKKTGVIQKRAWASFGIGLAALITYLAAYYFLASSAYDVLGWESADARRLIGEVLLLAVYGTFFALLTRAFVLLGMMEFFRQAKNSK